ncbi:uncharacterized protein KRP23_3016 [Phytophthora ramorum]|uniref:uncharacterized protein n=1 Tax=Phytophthora ramorum TaxID=164328 RepID=UPI0030B2564F|nr:hypothetical protein KRP23_3016 [Phytophthora ramorum]
MGLTGAGIIASVVGILGGVSLSCGGWSSLSLGARSLFVTTQFLSAFAMDLSWLSLRSSRCRTRTMGRRAAGGGAGFLIALIVGFMTFLRPVLHLLITGDSSPVICCSSTRTMASRVPVGHQLARQEFVIAFMIIFELVCCSSSKTSELENHRFKYIVFRPSRAAGWQQTVSRLVDSSAVLSDVAYRRSRRAARPLSRASTLARRRSCS